MKKLREQRESVVWLQCQHEKIPKQAESLREEIATSESASARDCESRERSSVQQGEESYCSIGMKDSGAKTIAIGEGKL